MSRKSEKFFDAITRLREDLIEEAQNYKFRKKTAVWKKYGSLAACVVLIMSIGFLAILPRGCGSSGGDSGGNADFNSSGAAPQVPQEAPSGDTAPPLYSGSGSGDLGGDPENASRPEEPEEAEIHQFTAIVIEVRDKAILVESTESDSPVQYLIPADPAYPVLAEGDRITVTCAGRLVLTTSPPLLPDVRSIEKIDPVE